MGVGLHAKAAALVSSRVPAVHQPATLVAPGSTRTKRAEIRANRVLEVSFKIKRAKRAVRLAAVGNLGGPQAKQVVHHVALGSTRTRGAQISANHALQESTKTSRGRAIAKLAAVANSGVRPP